jgi:DNA-binding MarR family transcriptional regulator
MDTETQNFLKVLQELEKLNPEFPLHYEICLAKISHKEGLSLTELSKDTGLALSTVSRIIGALSDSRQKGQPYELVQVKISEQEKRRKEIQHPQGKRLHALRLQHNGRIISQNTGKAPEKALHHPSR